MTSYLMQRPRAVRALAALVLLAVPTAAEAQIGHRPETSPYEDVKLGQTITLNGGWLALGRDPAGVAPDASLFAQIRYDAAVGGPASLYARYTLAPSQRALLAPGAIASKRKTGTPSVMMHVIEGGLDLALTGQKTWHHLIPSLEGGVGIVSDFAAADSGAYQFGVKFGISYGANLRYMRASGLQLRVGLTNFLWQYAYPDRYFTKAPDSTAILVDTKDRSKWKNNIGLSAGVSYPLFR